MTQEEKAKRYDEAIKRGLDYIRQTPATEMVTRQSILEHIFPELKESEDEKIRKQIKAFIKSRGSQITQSKTDAWLAWLDKQGEQKPADNVEPKFKIGDWVIDKQGIVHQIANVIENVTNHTYSYDIVGGGYFNDNTEGVRLWTIRDAKDGTVLVASDGSIFLFKDRVYSACKYYIALTTDGAVKFNNDGLEHYWETVTAVHPATKEQRDLLFQKMKEAGYEWDAEKKELKKIEQKPAWSEEDEKQARQIERIVHDDGCSKKLQEQIANWFKSLKDRVGCEVNCTTTKGWNKDDEEIILKMMFAFTTRVFPSSKECGSFVDFLKSLKHTWKPSDEQIKVLNEVLNFAANHESPHWNDYIFGTLNNHIRQLKKLREE